MKKTIISTLLILVILLQSLSLYSCGAKTLYEKRSFNLFNASLSLVNGYEKSEREFNRIADMVFDELDKYHKLFDIYNSYDGINNLYTVNSLVDGEHPTVKVDRRIIDLLLHGKEMYELTDGKVNIAMGSVLSLWHDYRDAGNKKPAEATLPSMDELIERSSHTDISNLIIDEESSTVYISDPLMTLDVGAIAKGYAVEMVARMLEEEGISGYALNVGGNVRAVGAKPDGNPWITGIENHTESIVDDYLAILKITSEAVVTSGSYHRWYEVDGKRYHHIIDSDTLMPAEGYISVSIITDNSALGDALSTALFCMSIDEGKALIEELDGVEVMWVTTDEVIHLSDGFNRYKISLVTKSQNISSNKWYI